MGRPRIAALAAAGARAGRPAARACRVLAPDIAEIQKLQALAESRRGNLPEALAHWQRALALDPSDRQAAYALALDTEREGGPENDAAAQRVLEQLVARSENLAARLEYVRIAAKRGDKAALDAALAPLTAASRTWSPDAQEQLKPLPTAAAANPRSAATQRRVPEERSPARAGVPGGACRGQHAARGSRRAADALRRA